MKGSGDGGGGGGGGGGDGGDSDDRGITRIFSAKATQSPSLSLADARRQNNNKR